LILFSSAVLRRLLLYTFGFLLVFTLCGIYYYWFASFQRFFDFFFIKSLLVNSESILTLEEVLYLCAPFAFIFVLAVFKTWGAARLTNFQQKVQQVIWLLFFGAGVTFFLSNEKSGHELVFLVPILCYFWTHYFILLKRRIFRIIMPGLMIFGLIGFSAYSYQNFTHALMIVEEPMAERKTMILGQDLAAYKMNEIASPCFQQEFSEEAFEGLDFYEDAIIIYRLFRKVNPEIIIDDMGVMTKLKMRFPYLEDNYEQTGRNTYQKVSN